MSKDNNPLYHAFSKDYLWPVRGENILYLSMEGGPFEKIKRGKQKLETRFIKETTYKWYLEDTPDLTIDGKPNIFDYFGGVFPHKPKPYHYLYLINGRTADAPSMMVKIKGAEFEFVGNTTSEGNATWLILYHLGEIVAIDGEFIIPTDTFIYDLSRPRELNEQHTAAQELKPFLTGQSELKVVGSSFTVQAFDYFRKYFDKNTKLQFIFTTSNIVEEPEFREYVVSKKFIYYDPHSKSYLQIEDSDNRLDYTFSGTFHEIVLNNQMKQRSIAKECADWIKESGAKFKGLKRPYSMSTIIYAKNKRGEVTIDGFVDFSLEGLGIKKKPGLTRTLANYDEMNTKGALQYFKTLWSNEHNFTDVTDKVLASMSTLFKENTPEFIYNLTLYHLFQDSLGEMFGHVENQGHRNLQDTQIWNALYDFQKDGARAAIEKIENFNGCIIADSVGLGKTYTALAVIKYYELRNDSILVLCPKRLRENWTLYNTNDVRNPFSGEEQFRYDVLNHTDLSRESGMSGSIDLAHLAWDRYKLVVIDESHNFRNNTPSSEHHISRYDRLMYDVIKKGGKTKVLMLTATPVNNRMKDLDNQIALITEDDPSALAPHGIRDIKTTLMEAQKVFNEWQELEIEDRTTYKLMEMMDMSYYKLLDIYTIARSRKHIHQYYDASQIGTFPNRLKPINRYSPVDLLGEFPPFEALKDLIGELILPIYQPLAYVMPKYASRYSDEYDQRFESGGSFSQLTRERHLGGMMRNNLLKRLESSIHSFTSSVSNILTKIELALDMVAVYKGNKRANATAGKYTEEELRDEFGEEFIEEMNLSEFVTTGKVEVDFNHLDLIRYEEDLRRDAEKLEKLVRLGRKVTPDRDAKLADLKALIKEKQTNPINPGNKKVLIFTEFADTAQYLYECLSEPLLREGYYTAMVTGGTNNNRSNVPIPDNFKKLVKINKTDTVLTLFSPNSKGMKKSFPDFPHEVDILIGTDCISEGQNLQDCDYCINYDIHWNPVRIVQRFGRVDRIGSSNSVIQLVNFWPVEDLDVYIKLEEKVKGKMAMLSASSTADENVLETAETQKQLDNEQNYRKLQLEKLRDQVVDLEDISGGINLTNLTLNEYKADLKHYIEADKGNFKLLAEAPQGLFALANCPSGVEPGVIFFLRQYNPQSNRMDTATNVIYPYYLVYVTNDKEVKIGVQQTRQVLDLYHRACMGEDQVIEELVNSFKSQTDDGYQMDDYTNLMDYCIEHIEHIKEEDNIDNIFTRGEYSNLKIQSSTNYELVTFLILK